MLSPTTTAVESAAASGRAPQWRYAPRVLLGIVAAFVAGGCASKPEVLPAQPHAPSSPAQVKIFSKAPKKYEQLGTILLTVTAPYKWDDRGDATPAFDAMK